MMVLKALGILLCIFILIPYLLGMLIIRIAKCNVIEQSVALPIILGIFCVFILYYFPAVVMIDKNCSLTLLTSVWICSLVILSLASFIIIREDLLKLLKDKYVTIKELHKENWLTKVLIISFYLLVIIQATFLSYSSLYDTDDARYIAESLDAIDTDKMLRTNPLTGENILEPIGEMTKDAVCPFSMFQASLAKITGIHPATLCHVILPLFLIPLCYMVYWLLASQIFGEDKRESCFIFLNLVCVLMMFGRMSAFWNSAYLLWRIWQGKAILATIVIPLIFYLMQAIIRDYKCIYNYIFLFIINMGSCILTPMSAIFPVIIIGVYTLLIWLYTKKAGVIIKMGVCCLPSVLLFVLSKVIGMMRYGL